MLDALPLSGLGALNDGLAEKGAHLLDPETSGKSKRHTKMTSANYSEYMETYVQHMHGTMVCLISWERTQTG